MSEKQYKIKRNARANDIPATVKRIFSYLAKYKLKLSIIFVCIVVTSLASVASSYFFTPIINNYVVPNIGNPNPDLSGFISMLWVMGIIYLTSVVCSFTNKKLMSIVSTNFLNDVRKDLFDHMQSMPVQFYDTHTHGDLMNFYSNDIDTMRMMIANMFPTLVSSAVSITGTVIMMVRTNFSLAAICLVSLSLITYISVTLSGKMRKNFAEMQKSIANINGFSEEMFSGQKVIKVFNHEKQAINEFKHYTQAAYNIQVKTNTIAGIVMPLNMNLSYFTYAVVAAVGANMVIKGTVSLGALASFLLYCRQVSGPISQVSQQFNMMMMSIAGAERVFNIIDSPVEVDDGKITLVNAVETENGLVETSERTDVFAWKNPSDGSLTKLCGDIRLHDVTFSYVPNKVVLHDVSLYAKPGQKIAFVGSTGAGKTTITNLINRFYDVQEGYITYDGIDIKDIEKASLRRSLGCVLQDTNLFTGTIMENIRYGNLDASDEECIAAAKLANADSFIKRLPQGFNTMLTDNGGNLSQGQRQLLNIARAAVANPPVLILDEATSSIDTHTEKLIEKGMDKLMHGRTVFVIAHRLSTVRNSNAIMVLEKGEIIERGDHEDLLKNKGRYYQLYTGKAELD